MKITPKKVVGFVLLLLLAATFFFSAFSKIYIDKYGGSSSFDQFQWSFFDLGFTSHIFTGIIARLLVGLEFALAAFLLLHIFLRRFTYKVILILLGIFTAYLVFLLIKQGNSGDCGCFGNKLALTPLQSILKNVAMAGVTLILMKIYEVKPYKNQDIVSIFVGIGALTVPFIVYPLNISTAPEPFTKQFTLDPLYSATIKPEVDLKKGKHIIGFMTLSCPHCKKAAYLMHVIHREHPEIPMYLVLGGYPSDSARFFTETHAADLPHYMLYDGGVFSGFFSQDEGYPAIYWVNNGKIEYRSKYTYHQLDPAYMEKWLKR